MGPEESPGDTEGSAGPSDRCRRPRTFLRSALRAEMPPPASTSGHSLSITGASRALSPDGSPASPGSHLVFSHRYFPRRVSYTFGLVSASASRRLQICPHTVGPECGDGQSERLLPPDGSGLRPSRTRGGARPFLTPRARALPCGPSTRTATRDALLSLPWAPRLHSRRSGRPTHLPS